MQPERNRKSEIGDRKELRGWAFGVGRSAFILGLDVTPRGVLLANPSELDVANDRSASRLL